MEKRGADLAGFFDMLLRQNRRAGSNAADDRQAIFGCGGFEVRNTYPARRPGRHLDSALAGKCLEMFFGSVGCLEAEFLSDLCASGWIPIVFQAALDRKSTRLNSSP